VKAPGQELSRRDFLRLSAVTGAGASLAVSPHAAHAEPEHDDPGPDTFNEATIAQLQAAMANRQTSATDITTFYLNRIQAIDEKGPHLNSVIELNPDALAMAQAADASRADVCSDRCTAFRSC
jgi:amidase